MLRLIEGRPVSLTLAATSAPDDEATDTMGMQILLDSMVFQKFTPSYNLEVYQTDSGATPVWPMPIDVFDLEPMKILKVGTSDFRFRLKAFYPNFSFTYTYPKDRDTIQPIAPGITLELKRKNAPPLIATMLSDVPNRARLEDAVGLGAALAFFWKAPQDSISFFAEASKISGPRIVFSEEDSLVYFIRNGEVDRQPLREQTYYPVSPADSIGFTILHCFPDVAFLKAEPSTQGTELLNPVAQIEYWPLKGRYQEAYVYPETGGKKGGEFAIPGTPYKIGLGINRQLALAHCTCFMSRRDETGSQPEQVQFAGNKAITFQGYTLTPLQCTSAIPGTLILKVAKTPGRIPVLLGSIMAGLALVVVLIRRNQYISKDEL